MAKTESVVRSLPAQTSRLSVIGNWMNQNKREFWILVVILVVGAFLRLYRIDEYMTFLGDEGRDVIVVRRLLANFDLILVGPGTSVGNMYLGPFYYYLMAPALLLSNFNPVGPAIMIALLSVLTIFIIWYISRKWFGKTAAKVASLLYAISPVVIHHARFSWNPNIMPFFSLLFIYSIWKFWKEQKWNWLLVSGITLGIILQSHYMGLVLFGVFGIFWILGLVKSWNNELVRKKAITSSIISFFLFTFLMSPLVIFDARHGWRNFSAMQEFFMERSGTVSLSLTEIINRVYPATSLVVTNLLAVKNAAVGQWLVFAMFLFFFWYLVVGVKSKKKDEYLLMVVWLFVGILGLSLYGFEIYDHYYGYMFTSIFIVLGAFSQYLVSKYNALGRVLVILLIGFLVVLNLGNNPLKYEPNKQLERTENVSRKIAQEANGEKFNIAVIADQNYEGAYWYFLEKDNEPIVGIDPLRYEETVADQLFVVCEYGDKAQCQPTSNPKTEVANFGWSKIDKQWDIDGLVLFRLVHAKQ